jgi:hypothetical protein
MWNRVCPAAAWKVEPNPAATVVCIDESTVTQVFETTTAEGSQ